MTSCKTFGRYGLALVLGLLTLSGTGCGGLMGVPVADPLTPSIPIPPPDPTGQPTPTQPPQSPKTPILFVANFSAGVVAFENPATANGNIAPKLNLSGPQTLLQTPWSCAIDNAGALLVVNRDAKSVTAYDSAETANGNRAPDRNIAGAATLLNFPQGSAIDRTSDVLFVSSFPNSVLVFDDASKVSGNTGPSRQITSADIQAPYGIALASNGDLYVANLGLGTVSVFANAGSRNGPTTADRVIKSPAFVLGAALVDVHVDANDTLYVLDLFTRSVLVFKKASTKNGAVMPDSILKLNVTGAQAFPYGVVVDSRGIGYISDSANHAIYAYDDLANRNGTLAPDRTIAGTNTQLNGPIQMYIRE